MPSPEIEQLLAQYSSPDSGDSTIGTPFEPRVKDAVPAILDYLYGRGNRANNEAFGRVPGAGGNIEPPLGKWLKARPNAKQAAADALNLAAFLTPARVEMATAAGFRNKPNAWGGLNALDRARSAWAKGADRTPEGVADVWRREGWHPGGKPWGPEQTFDGDPFTVAITPEMRLNRRMVNRANDLAHGDSIGMELKDVIAGAPELFAADPRLKTLPIAITGAPDENFNGAAFHAPLKGSAISDQPLYAKVVGSPRSPYFEDTLRHELGHIVGHSEFGGDRPAAPRSFTLDRDPDVSRALAVARMHRAADEARHAGEYGRAELVHEIARRAEDWAKYHARPAERMAREAQTRWPMTLEQHRDAVPGMVDTYTDPAWTPWRSSRSDLFKSLGLRAHDFDPRASTTGRTF